jgi:hypothetical protein
MSTRDLPFSFAEELAPSVARPRAASEKLAIGMVAVTFLVSYLQFCFERNDVVRLAPVVLLCAAAFCFLLVCPREIRREALLSVFQPSTWAVIAAVCVPALLSSLYRHASFPFQYGLVMIAVLFVVRILLSAVKFEGLLLAFFYATTVGLLIVVGMSVTDLLASIGATRYAPLQFDPNRIGFFAVTAIPAQLWFAVTRRHYYVLPVTALTLFVILAASSRGSTGALLIGLFAIGSLYILRLFRFSKFTLSRNKLLAGLLASCAIVGLAAAQGPAAGKAGQFLWDKLALDTRDRGVDSGFTGRTSGWTELLDIWPKTSWLAGNGYRTSEEDFTFSVDNGYFANLYEMGLLSTLVVFAKYLFVLFLIAVAYIRDKSAVGTCLAPLLFTCVIFFANAFVHRVFLGYGEHASMLMLFVFMACPSDVFETTQASQSVSWSTAQ